MARGGRAVTGKTKMRFQAKRAHEALFRVIKGRCLRGFQFGIDVSA